MCQWEKKEVREVEEKQNWEKIKKLQNIVRDEIIVLLRERQVTYKEALTILENAHSYIERAAFNQLV